ncbi:delta-60 repeat domain-containing protein [Candidatus Saccharibacteria bacterium]|nr:delta-60 repeat domain-containing protein [Candidatus Saccharibacteria bacterium]
MGIKALLSHTKTTVTVLALFASLLITALNPLSVAAAITNTAVSDFPQVNSNGAVYAIVGGADGSVYVGGNFTTIDGVARNDVARILSDGSVDSDFDPDVVDGVQYEELTEVRSLAFDEQTGTLYIGGNFDTINGSVTRNGLAAVDGQTGVVTGFNPNIIYGDDPFDYAGTVNALEINHDTQTIYVGGAFGYVNGATERVDLAAFSMSTGTVTAFNADISNFTCIDKTVYDLDYDSTGGQLYVAGHFGTFSDTARGGIARVDPDTGALDEGYNPDISSTEQLCAYVYSIERYGNTVYAGGIFDTVNGSVSRSNVAAFDTTDGTVTAFAPELVVDEYVYALEYLPASETLLIGGSITEVGGVARNELAEVMVSDGSLTDFNPNITSNALSVHALMNDSSGTLYAGGTFYRVGGVSRNGLAAFLNSDQDNDGISGEVEDAAPNNGDANNDGTPDSQQAHVTSILNTDSNEYVTIVSPSGTTISTTTVEAAPNEDGFTHLFGLTGFTISGVTPGDTIEVSLFYPNPDNLDPTTLTPKKYFPSTTSYQNLPSTAPTNTTLVSETIDGQPTLNLTYNLTDGGAYDLDQTADGQITDPVSLASTNRTTDALADTGENQIAMVVMTSLLFAAALYVTHRLRKA